MNAAAEDFIKLLRLTVERGASDLIISPGAQPALRVGGQLEFLPGERLDGATTGRVVASVLDEAQRERLETEKELDFAFTVKGLSRFRGNAYFCVGGLGCAIRVIPAKPPTLKELDLPTVLADFALRPRGLFLACGPTGQGKTTTLASMVRIINSTKRVHIVTVEDPVEFVHASDKSVIDQRDVGRHTLSYANALRSILRQDPDVIVIGEMRDSETMQAAITAAETGHLVLGCVHTNDSAQSVDRIVDMFPHERQETVREKLALTLTAVISLKLLPAKDDARRVPAYELMINNTAAGHLIREGRTVNLYQLIDTSSREGMVSMDARIKELFLAGRIGFDVAKRNVRDPKAMESL